MIVESFAIAGLIFVVVILYLRSKKRDYAFATIPFLILPLANVLAYTVSGRIAEHLPADKFTVYAAIDVIAVVISSCFVGAMSDKFGKKSTRAAYMIMSLIFNIVLAAILIFDMFERIYRA